MKIPKLTGFLPTLRNAGLAVLSAVLLALAFPDLEFWFLAWFALIPLLWAVEREKGLIVQSFVLGWIFGFCFFTATCWWLTFAPITYAGFPWPVAYLLLFCLTAIVGLFPALFAAIFSFLHRRLGDMMAILVAPTVWVFTEFLRYWLTGNNWNSVGYSQAFVDLFRPLAAFGGVAIISFLTVQMSSVAILALKLLRDTQAPRRNYVLMFSLFLVPILLYCLSSLLAVEPQAPELKHDSAAVIAIQPNVPMSGLTAEKWQHLRRKHVELSESALATINEHRTTNTTVIFPESPMNFMYEDDEEFREFVHSFAAKHDVNVLFNSAEPDTGNDKYFNSAVLVGANGREIAQYDKIYLVPFGESVPAPLQSIVPAFVGSFSYGKEYDLLPLGEAKAGVMICFESHFGELSREYVRNGADVIIEMTNDGYLGPTPVLRQHLANAVFRAVETNRPVLRVTNVGISAYINGSGEVLDATESYSEATRVWPVAKSDGSQTFYVKYGDWFAWLCSIVTIGLLIFGFVRRDAEARA